MVAAGRRTCGCLSDRLALLPSWCEEQAENQIARQHRAKEGQHDGLGRRPSRFLVAIAAHHCTQQRDPTTQPVGQQSERAHRYGPGAQAGAQVTCIYNRSPDKLIGSELDRAKYMLWLLWRCRLQFAPLKGPSSSLHLSLGGNCLSSIQ